MPSAAPPPNPRRHAPISSPARPSHDRTLALHDALSIPLHLPLPPLLPRPRALRAHLLSLLTDPTPTHLSTLTHLSLTPPYTALLPALLASALPAHPAALATSAHLVASSPYYYRALATPAFLRALMSAAKALPRDAELHPTPMVSAWAAALALAFPGPHPQDPAARFWRKHAPRFAEKYPHPQPLPRDVGACVCPFACLEGRVKRRAERERRRGERERRKEIDRERERDREREMEMEMELEIEEEGESGAGGNVYVGRSGRTATGIVEDEKFRSILRRYDAAFEAAAAAAALSSRDRDSDEDGEELPRSGSGSAIGGRGGVVDDTDARRMGRNTSGTSSGGGSVAAITRERARERGTLGARELLEGEAEKEGTEVVLGGGGGARAGGTVEALRRALSEREEEQVAVVEEEERDGRGDRATEPSEYHWSDAEEVDDEVEAELDYKEYRRVRGWD